MADQRVGIEREITRLGSPRMINKTALTDAHHLLADYHARHPGTVWCIKSFGAYDEHLGGIIVRAGECIAADHRLVERYPDNFSPDPSDRDAEGTDDDASLPEVALRSDPSPAPDVRGLLVCIHAFEFEDPDTGYLRGVRYGHDFVERDGWLALHYPDNFVRVEYVVWRVIASRVCRSATTTVARWPATPSKGEFYP